MILIPDDGGGIHSGDGVRRCCHPILAAYVGDYPEQCLVTTCYYGDCPCCETEKEDLGLFPTDECLAANIKPIQHPHGLDKDLPYMDIFCSITPDILHQMYQGVMKHLISWLTSICGANEMDACVHRLPPNHNIWIFHKGISLLSCVSGAKHKQMCLFILGTVVNVPGLTAPQSNALITATRALLDFLYLACFPIHSSSSLIALDESLADFHAKKDIFITLNVRKHFNFPKLHFLSHYSRAIKYFGTTDNYNTKTTERLHIDFTKDAYQASNHKDEYTQMTRWLEQCEKIIQHTSYISWRLGDLDGPFVPSMSILPTCHTLTGAQRTSTDMKCAFIPKITTHPTLKSVTLSKLEDKGVKGYGAVNFTRALKQFVVQFRNPHLQSNIIDEYAHFIVLPFRTLPIWHQVKFTNMDLFGKKTLDSVSAHPRHFNSHGQVTQLLQFDTALISLKSGTEDHTIQVFSLPEDELDTSFPANCHPPKHLAYVEWFSKFPRSHKPHSRLYQVKKEINGDGTVAASVIPVEVIIRSVHLLPKWGGTVPSEWTGETVLDLSPSFLLNIFKDDHSYYSLTQLQ
ncbi:hypothetical protein F5876DRAFT_90747 [Lentinula aff. lateritia]|uniref:Uncharacterized protein n=1 Tax=Lentinula aff. lateritia TaxID=2804960 RepID=A0ACC1TQQ9_9AGAR|nr:hypothetical protein F5876DRAFT_90747 [Lentinula aff. lateritia]